MFDSEKSLVVHATGKLARKLRVPELTAVASETRPHLVWYANVFTAERVQYILTTNAVSLYSVVIPGRRITDDTAYVTQFVQTLCEHLEDDGVEPIFERCIAPYTGDVILAKTVSRSVLGSMNDMVNSSKYLFARGDTTPWDVSKQINDTPYGGIGYGFPNKAFKSMPVGG
jgi:hypothetical protein